MNFRAAYARARARARLPRKAGAPFRAFAAKQELAKPGRYYGDGGTIHGTNRIDVCLDRAGQVVQVWFRCQQLPFVATYGTDRVYHDAGVIVTGIEVRDVEDGE